MTRGEMAAAWAMTHAMVRCGIGTGEAIEPLPLKFVAQYLVDQYADTPSVLIEATAILDAEWRNEEAIDSVRAVAMVRAFSDANFIIWAARVMAGSEDARMDDEIRLAMGGPHA